MQAALLARGLRSRGHQCSILCRADGEFGRRMKQEGFNVHLFPKRGRSPVALLKIRQTLRQLKPDVIHANDAHALTASGIASLGLSVPMEVAARRVDFPLRSPRRYTWFSHGLICVSNAVARICEASGVNHNLLHVVHDGVDPAYAQSGSRSNGRNSLGLKNEPLLLTVAKLTDHKGHRYLLDALPSVLEANPTAVIAFAGDGELRELLQRQAAELGVQSNVRFLGYRNDVNDLLAAADLVIQPSHMEGLCSSLIDAMLAARPIVASHAGGIPDLLEVNEGAAQVGWLVPPKSPESLANAINEALADQTAAQRRGLDARERALQKFTADNMVDATLATYRRIAEGLNLTPDRQAAFDALPSLPSTATSAGSATDKSAA